MERTGCGRGERPATRAVPEQWPGDLGACCLSSVRLVPRDAVNPQALWSLLQVAGRLHVEVMRVTGTVPERVVEDDSSENSSEGGSLEVVDSSGEVIHRVRKLTCRVRGRGGRAGAVRACVTRSSSTEHLGSFSWSVVNVTLCGHKYSGRQSFLQK